MTGSQPVVASKPRVPHPGFHPEVMSFRADGLAYSHGFRKPRTGLPAFRSSSFSRAITDVKMGEAHDVPGEEIMQIVSVN